MCPSSSRVNRTVVLLGALKLLSIILSCLVCWMDGIKLLRRYFPRVLCIVDDALPSLHESQGVASLDLVFLLFFFKNNMPVLLASPPFSRCSFVGMVFLCKCVVLSDVFFSPSMFRQIRAIFCVLKPSVPPADMLKNIADVVT